MLSFELWRTLHDVPTHTPLMRISRDRPVEGGSFVQRVVSDYFPIAIILLMALSAWLLGIFIVLGAGLLLLFGGAFYGLLTVYSVSRAVARHRARGYYDLIMMTPPGVLAMQWAISAYALQRSDMLAFVRSIMHRLYITVFILIALIFVFTLLTMNRPMTKYAPNLFVETVAPALLSASCLVALHYLDFTRSGLSGALFGLLIPTFTEGRRETVYLAISLYTALQLLFYTACWVLGFETLRQVLTLAGVPSETMHNLIRLALMLLIREVSLFVLWRWLLWRLNVNPSESRAELARQPR